MIATHPKFRQQTFDHMRRLIDKVKDRALIQHDLNTHGDADLLDALLLRFVEDVEGSIIVRDGKV